MINVYRFGARNNGSHFPMLIKPFHLSVITIVPGVWDEQGYALSVQNSIKEYRPRLNFLNPGPDNNPKYRFILAPANG
jgi:hypothetical protein